MLVHSDAPRAFFSSTADHVLVIDGDSKVSSSCVEASCPARHALAQIQCMLNFWPDVFCRDPDHCMILDQILDATDGNRSCSGPPERANSLVVSLGIVLSDAFPHGRLRKRITCWQCLDMVDGGTSFLNTPLRSC